MMPMTAALFALLIQPSIQQDAWPQIEASSILTHIKYLASDELKGRNTPSEGLDKAADYLADEFKKAGLKPGNGDSWFLEANYTGRRGGASGPVKSVVAVVPGTDPQLKEEYVLVSAHYDHLGERQGEGDQIYNGANDNASGTVGLIEAGAALMKTRPRRSVMFVALWGEEKGLRGSRAFVQDPPVPLSQIIANINLEQIGRTDDNEGPRVEAASITGYDYTTLTDRLIEAGKKTGVTIEHHKRNSSMFFMRSDNAAFAAAGIPAHTISTCYIFPDYHRATDHWDKIDASNMTKIVEMVTDGIAITANSKDRPTWVEGKDATKRYREAFKELYGDKIAAKGLSFSPLSEQEKRPNLLIPSSK
jgi:hypothetical protein